MKILHLDSGQSMRGGQYQLLMLLEGLRTRGYDQMLLAGRPLVERWNAQHLTISNLLRASRSAQIIHAHDARSHTLAALFCPRKPLVVSRRVAFPVRKSRWSRWKYEHGWHYIAVSEHVRGRLLDGDVPARDITVVHDGVSTQFVENCKRDRFSAGMSTVVAPEIADPLKKNELLQHACKFAGVQLCLTKELSKNLSGADVFVYLSTSEGFGSAVLLAMARRIPVVASRVGGLVEIVDHEKTGLLVDNNVNEVGSAIRRIIENPDFAESCAEQAFQLVSKKFTDDIMVEGTRGVYRDLLRSQPRC